MTGEVQVGDIGTLFEVTITEDAVALDISTATAILLLFKKPSGELLTKTATFSGDGSDGNIQYISILDDIDEPGVWYLQGNITLPGGQWSSEKGNFVVGGGF